MKEIIGEYWIESPKYNVLCVTTNGILTKDGRLVMGAGIAKEFRDKYKGLDCNLGTFVKFEGNIVHVINWEEGLWLASFPTKNDWKDKSDIKLIEKSAKQLVKEVNELSKSVKVLLTRPGCGMGGLTWDEVRPILSPLLDDRFTVISKE